MAHRYPHVLRALIAAWMLFLALPAKGQTAPDLDVAASDAGAPSSEAASSRLQVLVFSEGGGPYGQGVEVWLDGVEADGAPDTTTNDDGVARLIAPAGTHALHLRILPVALGNDAGAPDAPVPGLEATPEAAAVTVVDLSTVYLEPGETTQVIVNLTADGKLASVDVEGPTPPETTSKADEPVVAEETVVETGLIRGQVRSSETRAPIEGARVYARGVDAQAVTDANGTFLLEVSVGVHSAYVIHPKFSDQTATDIVVAAQQTAEATIEMTPAAAQLDDVVITAPHIKGGVASVLSERRQASSVQDALGAEDIAKSPDGSASSATRRIVGASIVGGQFLLVRGLGGRYSNTRLNGVPLPSTDPDLPGFQLDLFPTSLLSGLTVSKTFSADIPADFAGGSLNVETRTFPEEFMLRLSASGTYNTETTGRDILSYEGGATDYLGFDDGTRALPDGVPEERVAVTRGGFSGDEVGEFSSLFSNKWELLDSTAYPNLSLGFSVGDTLGLGAGKLGYFLTLGYRNSVSRYQEQLTSPRLEGVGDDQRITPRETLWREVGSRNAQIGTLGTVSYAPNDDHSLSVVSLLTQSGSDQASRITGLSEREARNIDQQQLRYIERQLLFNQLLGKHDKLGDTLNIDWQLNTSRTLRDQPDTRGLVYREEPAGYTLQPGVGSGERLYTGLEQVDYGGGVDLEVPLLTTGAAKAGYLGRTSERNFRARRFRLSAATSADRLLPPEEFFEPDLAGEQWRFNEVTRADDGFDAQEDLHAAYGLLELPVLTPLRLVAGLRIERFRQRIVAVTPYAVEEVPEEEPAGADRTDLDYLPAASLIYALSEQMSLRAAYGRTVARPQIRELSPFLNQDYVRRRTIIGNSELKRTAIHNFDLRWELFPSPTEVFAVSVFYKIFDDPIESVVVDQGGNIKFQNIDGATNYGAEFEARLGLGLLSRDLEALSLMANLSLINSAVSLSEEQQRVATNAERPLAGQSPFVANLALGYEPLETGFSTFLYYNVFGRRIDEVGILGLPDVYEEAVHSLDYTAFYSPDDQWTFGLTASNLLMSPVRYTQGGINYSRYSPGMSVGLSAEWEY